MKPIILTALCVHLFCSVFSQEVLFEKEIKLKRGLREKREAYPVTNPYDQHISLFLIDNSTIKAHLFNNNLELVDTLEGPRPDNRFPELLGSNQSEGKYNLFFASRSYGSFAIVSYDYTNKTVRQHIIELPLKKEKYAGSASYGGKFYLLTTFKASSILKLYIFTDHTNYTTNTYDFNNELFAPSPYFRLHDVLREAPFIFIDNEIPNAIDLVAKKNKLYCNKNKIILTLDNQLKRTGIITIDLKTQEGVIDFFDQGKLHCGETAKASSNSYLYKNNLYQFIVCPLEMTFSISNLQNAEILSEFKVAKDEDLYFKNSAIIQQGGGTLSAEERELSKTRQFLRKAAASEAGVSAYETSEGIEITLGSYKEIQQGGGGGGMMTGGGSISTPYGPVPVAPTYNPTFNGYSAYKTTRSVYFKSLLNTSTFSHKEGIVPKNAFDKIQAFTKGRDDNMTAETIFKKEDVCLLGYYSKSNGHYLIRAFRD